MFLEALAAIRIWCLTPDRNLLLIISEVVYVCVMVQKLVQQVCGCCMDDEQAPDSCSLGVSPQHPLSLQH